MKDKFGIDEFRQKYFIQGIKLALKNVFVAGEFLEFYKEFGFNTGLNAIYGSYTSEALRILESSFSDHDFTAVNMELVSFHMGDLALALDDGNLSNEDKKRYEAIRTNSKKVNDLKINFDNKLSQLIQCELLHRDSLMEVFLNFNGSIKFVGSMICLYYAKIHKTLTHIGNSLTDSNDRNHSKHVIETTYKNLEVLLEFIADLLSKQTITANQANDCKKPIQVWIECLPSLRKVTYND